MWMLNWLLVGLVVVLAEERRGEGVVEDLVGDAPPADEPEVVVGTGRGPVRGIRHDLGNNRSALYYGISEVYLGIPYALPPIGDRRFKLPQPICKYDKEIFETDYKPRCPSYEDYPESEDCLYLNVFTPNSTSTRKYPVMVYIHGGIMMIGGASDYDWKPATRNFVSRDVVVVTIQYRLGMLGFFTTFTADYPANRGIYDEIMALRWVQEEIEHFGGDPNRVTLFGHSSGAATLSTLSLTPLTRGLFQQYIQIAGSILMEYETPDNYRGSIHEQRAKQLCHMTDDQWNGPNRTALLDACLPQKTSQDFTKYDRLNTPMTLSWDVGMDGALLPEGPIALAATRPNYPNMIVDNDDDFSLSMQGFAKGNFSIIGPNTLLELVIAETYKYMNISTMKMISDMSVKAYMRHALEKDDHVGWAQLVSAASNGLSFSSILRQEAQWYKNNGNDAVFLMTFDYISPICLDYYFDVAGWAPANHMAIICYLWMSEKDWRAAEQKGTLTQKDFDVVDNLADAFVNFAKTGSADWRSLDDDWPYVIMTDENKPRTNWRDKANTLYNIAIPTVVGGEFPYVQESEGASEALKADGAKVLDDWDKMVCADYESGTSSSSSSPPTSSAPSSTSSSSSTTTTEVKAELEGKRGND